MDEASQPPAVLERITLLESALAHHQREFDQLNQVVIEQSEYISKLQRRLIELEASLKSVERQIPEERDIAEEKPPHY